MVSTAAPGVGATEIQLRPSAGMLICLFCRHEWSEARIDETIVNGDLTALRGTTVGSGASDIDTAADTLITMKCAGCGAEVVVNTAEQMGARCHWCRHVLTVNEQVPNGAVPDAVLPFKITHADTMAKIHELRGQATTVRRSSVRARFQRCGSASTPRRTRRCATSWARWSTGPPRPRSPARARAGATACPAARGRARGDAEGRARRDAQARRRAAHRTAASRPDPRRVLRRPAAHRRHRPVLHDGRPAGPPARRRPPAHAGVLFLDNPIGRASASYLLELQFGVARALGVQLVYTTGLFDAGALSAFPLVIRLRNDADLRAGRKYLSVDARIATVLDALAEADGTGRVEATRVFRRPGHSLIDRRERYGTVPSMAVGVPLAPIIGLTPS